MLSSNEIKSVIPHSHTRGMKSSQSFLTLTRKKKKSHAFLIISYILNGIAMGSMNKGLSLLLSRDDPRESEFL